MVNFSDCYIAKVKSFFGFKSIDPPLPFDEFLQKNLKNLKSLVKNKQIIAFDDQGKEIDILLLEAYIHTSYEEIFKKIDPDINKENNEESVKNDSNSFQHIFDKIKLIDTEEKAKLEHKQRLTESLKGCDETYRLILEKGITRNDKKIEKLQEERQSLLNQMSEKTKNS